MKRKNILIITSIFLISLFALAIFIYKYKNSNLKVTLDTAKTSPILRTTSVTGKIEPTNDFKTMASMTSKIDKINFKEGDKVKKGDVIFRYDTSDLEFQLKKAKLNRDLLNSSTSNQNTQNIKDNIPQNIPPNIKDQIVDVSSKTPATQNSIEMQKKLSSADISMLENKISSQKLTSPINGVITKMTIKEGQIPTPESIIIIEDTSSYRVKLNLSQLDSTSIKTGQSVTISVNGIEDTFKGEVLSISSSGEITSPTSSEASIPCYVSLIGDTSKIKSGFEGECTIILEEKNSLNVSFDSVKKDDNGIYVFINENGKAKKRYIKTGIKSDFEIEVLEGLSDGEKYIKNPPETLTENMRISEGGK